MSYVEQWTKPPPDDNGDHSSSSVMSTSCDDEAVAYHDDFVDKSAQPNINSYRNRNGSHDGPLPSSWENYVCLPSTANENLDVEYGRLAILKQELERKIQVRELDATRAHGGVKEVSEQLNSELGQHTSFMSDRKDDTAGIRESVEHQYGQLTFFKRQLECNMQMQNLGVRNLDPWMPRAIYDDAVAIREGIAGRDEAPSREDVAFGDMVYH
jgi:hypothetical protein